MVYLVRHAHAGNKKQWQGPDSARPLSAQGRKEALGLIEQLRDRPVRRLLSSPAERCLQTVEPLAGRLGRVVEPSRALGVDGTVVIGHGRATGLASEAGNSGPKLGGYHGRKMMPLSCRCALS